MLVIQEEVLVAGIQEDKKIRRGEDITQLHLQILMIIISQILILKQE